MVLLKSLEARLCLLLALSLRFLLRLRPRFLLRDRLCIFLKLHPHFIYGVLTVMLLSGGLAALLSSKVKVFQSHHIEVEIDSGPWSQEFLASFKKSVMNQLDPLRSQSIFTVNLNELSKKLKNDRRIQHISIQRILPHRMKLKMTLHKPIALLMGLQNELLSVSRDASILPPMGEAIDLPILRGLNFHKEEKLRAQALEFLEQIPKTGFTGYNNISEIRFDKKSGYVLYLLPHGVQLHLGQSHFAQKINRAERVMNYLENQNMKYRVIDARFPKKIVVKLRNET